MEDVGSAIGVLLFVVAFALASKRLTAGWLTAPLAFVLFGGITGVLGVVNVHLEDAWVGWLAELTLVLVLFVDATRIDVSALWRESGPPVRLLGVALPLTIGLGALLAWVLVPGLQVWQALALGAILAPTDAALGQAVVTSEAVPLRIRQTLNVESGLNDGIALPFVLASAALGASEGGFEAGHWLGFLSTQIAIGAVLGVALGALGGRLLRAARDHDSIAHTFEGIAGLGVALLCWLIADHAGGNGFIAVFVGGMAFGQASGRQCGAVQVFMETEGQLLMFTVFLMLGCTLAEPAISRSTWHTWAYAVGSLTVVRMLPTALSLLGSGAKGWTVVFVGWFGPRGLASLLFAMLLGEHVLEAEPVFDVVVCTVLLSVFAHGVTATWGARHYGAWVAEQTDGMEHDDAVTAHAVRRLGVS